MGERVGRRMDNDVGLKFVNSWYGKRVWALAEVSGYRGRLHREESSYERQKQRVLGHSRLELGAF